MSTANVARSNILIPQQGNLFNEPVEELPDQEEYIEVASHKKHRGSKKSVPKDLPVDEVVYGPSEALCPCCSKELKEFLVIFEKK